MGGVIRRLATASAPGTAAGALYTGVQSALKVQWWIQSSRLLEVLRGARGLGLAGGPGRIAVGTPLSVGPDNMTYD